MQSTNSARPSLGQPASICSLYNARTDEFLPYGCLAQALPDTALQITTLNRASKHSSHDDTYQEKFQQFQLTPELSATVLAGFINIQGNALYLTESRSSSPTIHQALIYTLETVHEKLNLSADTVKWFFDIEHIKSSQATHIVTEVTWGARCIVSATKRLFPGQDSQRAKGDLDEEFQSLETENRNGFKTQRHFNGQFESGDQHSTHVRVYSDFAPGDQSIHDLEGARRNLLNLPNEFENINDGKGIQLSYTLFPIALLSFFGVAIPSSISVGQLSPECHKRLITLLDDLSNAERDLTAYYTELERHKSYIAADHLIQVGNQIRYVAEARSKLLKSYAISLKSIREGTGNTQEVWDLVDKFLQEDCAPIKLLAMKEEYEPKMNFIDQAVEEGAMYIGYNEKTVEDFLQRQKADTTFVFFFNAKTMGGSDEWNDQTVLLFNTLRDELDGSNFAIVDCDAISKQITKPVISQYRGQKLLIEDISERQKELADKNLIRYEKHQLRPTDSFPSQRRTVKSRCPGRHCDSSVTCSWLCFSCYYPIEYGVHEQLLFCACGMVPHSAVSFKCCNPNHGPDFETFKNKKLLAMLQELPSPTEMNILILGETGVGKSTFINAFINYLTFESLDHALKSDGLEWVIPCSFALQRADPKTGLFKETKVQVDYDEDERDGMKGQSATQKATVYPIYIGSQLVRLIDTPGMGDTRGPEQDRMNMTDVLSVLRNYDKLHGILILLKPNNARLNFMFRFVVQELLTHLHRSAATNMVFGFTNTRGSNYAPGDTFVPLATMLSEFKDVIPNLNQSNVYCFDSESFRYLAATKVKGIDMGNFSEYENSWRVSADASKRLMDHFQHLTPHPVQETLSLNETRYLIQNLIAPMRQVSKAIIDTIEKSEKQRADLMTTQATGKVLAEKLMIQKTNLSAEESTDPITACTNIACVKKVTHDEGGEVKVHKSLCHNPCCLKNVAPHIIAAAGLQNCAAFSGGSCIRCKHRWNEHEHILVFWSETSEHVEDPTVAQELKGRRNEIKAKEAGLATINRRIPELKDEHCQLQEAAARFTVYLRANSITSINDAALEYLDHLIKEEKTKVQLGGNPARLEALEKERTQYKDFRDAFFAAYKDGVPGAVLDGKGVYALVRSLYSMKHYGKILRDVAKVVGTAYAKTFREKPHYIPPKHHWMKQTIEMGPRRSMLDIEPFLTSNMSRRPFQVRSPSSYNGMKVARGPVNQTNPFRKLISPFQKGRGSDTTQRGSGTTQDWPSNSLGNPLLESYYNTRLDEKTEAVNGNENENGNGVGASNASRSRGQASTQTLKKNESGSREKPSKKSDMFSNSEPVSVIEEDEPPPYESGSAYHSGLNPSAEDQATDTKHKSRFSMSNLKKKFLFKK